MSPERAAGLQSVQMGVEAVAGTGVAANRLLQSLTDFTPGIGGDVNMRKPTGTKFPTLAVPGREWVDASFEGNLDYNEIVYFLLASVKGIAEPAVGGSGEKVWEFAMSRAAQDFPKTLTVEQGNPERAHKFVHGFIPNLSMSFTPDEATFSGSFIAKDFADGIAMTAGPTSPPAKPVHPGHVSLYLADTQGGLAAGKLTRGFAADFGFSDKYGTVFPIDAALNRGFAGIVERSPSLDVSLTLESDAAGMGLLSTMRTGATKWLRIEAIGSLIGGAVTNRLTIETPVKIDDMGDFGEDQDVVVNEWSLSPIWDTQGPVITVVNALAL